jgi:hypothetical protein
MISAHPLTWPDIIPRSRSRESGQFKATLAAALNNVETSLRRFGNDSRKPVKDIVLSSNVTLGVTRPSDPGVAAWFTWDGDQVCIPVDRYTTVEANLQAIHHIIEARRVELRHGTLALVKASFRGFRALPPPPGSKHWSDVLNVSPAATPEEIDRAYRKLASAAHPDRGGSHEQMTTLNRARELGLQEARP